MNERRSISPWIKRLYAWMASGGSSGFVDIAIRPFRGAGSPPRTRCAVGCMWRRYQDASGAEDSTSRARCSFPGGPRAEARLFYLQRSPVLDQHIPPSEMHGQDVVELLRLGRGVRLTGGRQAERRVSGSGEH